MFTFHARLTQFQQYNCSGLDLCIILKTASYDNPDIWNRIESFGILRASVFLHLNQVRTDIQEEVYQVCGSDILGMINSVDYMLEISSDTPLSYRFILFCLEKLPMSHLVSRPVSKANNVC